MNSSLILKVAFIAIILVNVWGALPPFQYAPWIDLKRDEVRVYMPHGETSFDAIPIQGADTATGYDTFAKTGQTVNVCVQSGYRNSGARTYPQVTVGIVAFTLLLLALCRVTSPKI